MLGTPNINPTSAGTRASCSLARRRLAAWGTGAKASTAWYDASTGSRHTHTRSKAKAACLPREGEAGRVGVKALGPVSPQGAVESEEKPS